MADTTDTTPTAPSREMPEGGNMPIVIHAQYVKDLSFENPNTPESLRGAGGAPEMDVNIGMDARKIPSEQEENLYEVALNVRAEATRKGECFHCRAAICYDRFPERCAQRSAPSAALDRNSADGISVCAPDFERFDHPRRLSAALAQSG